MANKKYNQRTFTMSEEEWEAARNWITTHVCAHRGKPQMTIGYLFTPTGIGTAVDVQCSCGSSYNATDYRSW